MAASGAGARPSSRVSFPAQILTPRLVLRVLRRTDAPLLKSAVDANLEHLRAFMPWARKEPSTLQVMEQRIDKSDQRFRADSEWSYGIFSSGEKMFYGKAAVHRSTEKGALEIGFWLGKGWTRHGYATEAVKALVDAAMKVPGVQRVQIRCDVRNTTSAAVAQRSGFQHVETIKNHIFEKGVAARDTMVWEFPGTGARAASAAPAKRGVWATLKSLFGAK